MKIEGFADTIKWYDQNAEEYSRVTKDTYSLEEINKFVSLISKGGIILNGGCASGKDSTILFKKGLKVIGIDLSKGLIEIARKEHPEVDWSRGTTYRQGRERGLAEYEGFLGFEKGELKGKRVLDVGSGETELFSRELKEKGVEGEVICLNPDYIDKNLRKGIAEEKLWRHSSVAAIAQRLPFPNESFDIVLGLYSATAFLDPKSESKAVLAWGREVARVLKPGGKALFAPVIAFDEKTLKKNYADIIRAWRENDLQVEVDQLTERDLGLSESSDEKVVGFFRLRLIK